MEQKLNSIAGTTDWVTSSDLQYANTGADTGF